MDLPPPSQQDNTTPPLSSGSTSASSSMTSLDKQTCDDAEEDETLGDHFAKQNQSTLKKNEKYQDLNVKKNEKSNSENRVSAKIEEIVLRIEEANEKPDMNRLSTGSIKDRDKSPIPSANTQKFVSQFADLKLTGGCSAKTGKPTTKEVEKPEKEKTNFIFGSFKPPISIKPQILQKKKSLFLQAHSSSSPSTSPDPLADRDHN